MNMANIYRDLPNALIGIAGVHFVVSQLTLRGLIALPTIRNTGGIDILVSELDGSNQAFLQVKTSLKKVNFWPTPRPEKCLMGPRSFYVFLRYLTKEERFEAFLESGPKVAKQVGRNLQESAKLKQKEFPYWGLPSSNAEIQKLRKNWGEWRPPSG
jgi:hypothetical protein